MKQKIIVFYDGKCSLCSKEINYYKKIAPNNIFNWQDITVSDKLLKKEGLSLTEGLRFLHIKDTNNNILNGVDSFIIIWQQLKYWKILAYFVSLPIVKQITNFCYKKFANYRFKKLGYCNLETK